MGQIFRHYWSAVSSSNQDQSGPWALLISVIIIVVTKDIWHLIQLTQTQDLRKYDAVFYLFFTV